MSDAYPSRSLDKIVIRVPDGMRERIAKIAKANGRSMNAEIVFRLEEWLAKGAVVPEAEPRAIQRDGVIELIDALRRLINKEELADGKDSKARGERNRSP